MFLISAWQHVLWISTYGLCKAKMRLRACAKYINSDSSHGFVKCHPGICLQLLHSVLSNDPTSGQRRP